MARPSKQASGANNSGSGAKIPARPTTDRVRKRGRGKGGQRTPRAPAQVVAGLADGTRIATPGNPDSEAVNDAAAEMRALKRALDNARQRIQQLEADGRAKDAEIKKLTRDREHLEARVKRCDVALQSLEQAHRGKQSHLQASLKNEILKRIIAERVIADYQKHLDLATGPRRVAGGVISDRMNTPNTLNTPSAPGLYPYTGFRK